MATKAKTTAAVRAAAQPADTKPIASAKTLPAVPPVGTDAAQAPAASLADEAKPAEPTASVAGEGAAVAVQLGGFLAGAYGADLDVLQEGTGGEVIADPASEIAATVESRPSGWVITCIRRDRGLWRAGRFWPPEPTPVAEGELTPAQFAQLHAEKLLRIEKVA